MNPPKDYYTEDKYESAVAVTICLVVGLVIVVIALITGGLR